MKTKKTIVYSIIASLLISLVLFSCNKDDEPGNIQQGEVEFGFSLKDISQTKTKSLKADVEPYAIVVSIKDATGTLVYDIEEIELFNMNGYFISKPLSLLVGSYSLEKFFVIDADGNVIYASPLEDSDLAYLVSEPLPIEFNVSKDETLKLVPEVLSTEVLTPEDFGYTTFSFDIVETFDFLLSVFVYNETNENFELTDAMLSILANENTIYSDSLQAITNQIKINDGFASYILTVEKEAYTTYVDTFTNEELKLYFSSENNGPMVVILENGEPVAGTPCPGAPTVTDADGNVYPTVQIGDQCWMAENLNTYSKDSWYYDNDSLSYSETYGRLYEWEAANNICPSGWYLPSYNDWDRLIKFLQPNEGGKLKAIETEYWNAPNEGATNESGFNALPGGVGASNSSFFANLGYYTLFASSTTDYEYDSTGNYFHVLSLSYISSYASLGNNTKVATTYVRCIKN